MAGALLNSLGKVTGAKNDSTANCTSRLADDGNWRDFVPGRPDHGIQPKAKGEGRTMTKKINTTHTGTRSEILDAMSSAYAAMLWADESKRYEFTVREIPAIGANLTFGDYGPMTDDEELTYAEVWENQQKFDNKRERAYLEPLDRGDVAGNEVQPEKPIAAEKRCNAPILFDPYGNPYCHKGYQCAVSLQRGFNPAQHVPEFMLNDESGVCKNFVADSSLSGNDDEVQPYQAVKRAVVFEVE